MVFGNRAWGALTSCDVDGDARSFKGTTDQRALEETKSESTL